MHPVSFDDFYYTTRILAFWARYCGIASMQRISHFTADLIDSLCSRDDLESIEVFHLQLLTLSLHLLLWLRALERWSKAGMSLREAPPYQSLRTVPSSSLGDIYCFCLAYWSSSSSSETLASKSTSPVDDSSDSPSSDSSATMLGRDSPSRSQWSQSE